jgi:hypothetical protein
MVSAGMISDAMVVVAGRGAVATSTAGLTETASAPQFQPDGDHRDANHDRDRRR